MLPDLIIGKFFRHERTFATDDRVAVLRRRPVVRPGDLCAVEERRYIARCVEISELIYETCKTYLVTQGKFIRSLWVFIAVIISLYFGYLAPVPGKSIAVTLPIILLFQPRWHRGQLRRGVVRNSRQHICELQNGICGIAGQAVSGHLQFR